MNGNAKFSARVKIGDIDCSKYTVFPLAMFTMKDKTKRATLCLQKCPIEKFDVCTPVEIIVTEEIDGNTGESLSFWLVIKKDTAQSKGGGLYDHMISLREVEWVAENIICGPVTFKNGIMQTVEEKKETFN